MWRPPDKRRWGALGFGLLCAWFGMLCGWRVLGTVLFAAGFHELGHFLMLRGLGAAVTGLRLSPWGAVMACRREKLSYGGEMAALLAGPAANFLASGVLSLLPEPPEGLIGAGLVLGGFNLLPLRGLDGGETLRCGLTLLLGPERGERIARGISRLTAAHLAMLCLFIMCRSGGNLFLFPALLLFLGKAGEGRGNRPEKRKFAGKTACNLGGTMVFYQGVKGRSSAASGPKSAGEQNFAGHERLIIRRKHP